MIDLLKDKKINSFYKKLYKENKKILKKSANDETLLQNIEATLEGRGVSKRIKSNIKMSRWEIGSSGLFLQLAELFDSIEHIDMISVFIKQYPSYRSYKSNKITPTKYLRYHVENYLHEAYLFRRRFEKFIHKLKGYRDKYSLNDKEILKNSLRYIGKSFEGVVQARGYHVYVKRFNEDSLDRLSFLELVEPKRKKGRSTFQIMLKLQYRKDRAKWSRDIRKNALSLRTLLGEILGTLESFVFDELKAAMIEGSKIKRDKLTKM